MGFLLFLDFFSEIFEESLLGFLMGFLPQILLQFFRKTVVSFRLELVLGYSSKVPAEFLLKFHLRFHSEFLPEFLLVFQSLSWTFSKSFFGDSFRIPSGISTEVILFVSLGVIVLRCSEIFFQDYFQCSSQNPYRKLPRDYFRCPFWDLLP